MQREELKRKVGCIANGCGDAVLKMGWRRGEEGK